MADMNESKEMQEYIAECEILLEETVGQLAYIADTYNADLDELTNFFVKSLKEELHIRG
jgi:chromosome condensin MukBEF complex kleisin-like MukF subunit